MTITDYNEKLTQISARLQQVIEIMTTLENQRTLLLEQFEDAKAEYEASQVEDEWYSK